MTTQDPFAELEATLEASREKSAPKTGTATATASDPFAELEVTLRKSKKSGVTETWKEDQRLEATLEQAEKVPTWRKVVTPAMTAVPELVVGYKTVEEAAARGLAGLVSPEKKAAVAKRGEEEIAEARAKADYVRRTVGGPEYEKLHKMKGELGFVDSLGLYVSDPSLALGEAGGQWPMLTGTAAASRVATPAISRIAGSTPAQTAIKQGLARLGVTTAAGLPTTGVQQTAEAIQAQEAKGQEPSLPAAVGAGLLATVVEGVSDAASPIVQRGWYKILGGNPVGETVADITAEMARKGIAPTEQAIARKNILKGAAEYLKTVAIEAGVEEPAQQVITEAPAQIRAGASVLAPEVRARAAQAAGQAFGPAAIMAGVAGGVDTATNVRQGTQAVSWRDAQIIDQARKIGVPVEDDTGAARPTQAVLNDIKAKMAAPSTTEKPTAPKRKDMVILAEKAGISDAKKMSSEKLTETLNNMGLLPNTEQTPPAAKSMPQPEAPEGGRQTLTLGEVERQYPGRVVESTEDGFVVHEKDGPLLIQPTRKIDVASEDAVRAARAAGYTEEEIAAAKQAGALGKYEPGKKRILLRRGAETELAHEGTHHIFAAADLTPSEVRALETEIGNEEAVARTVNGWENNPSARARFERGEVGGVLQKLWNASQKFGDWTFGPSSGTVVRGMHTGDVYRTGVPRGTKPRWQVPTDIVSPEKEEMRQRRENIKARLKEHGQVRRGAVPQPWVGKDMTVPPPSPPRLMSMLGDRYGAEQQLDQAQREEARRNISEMLSRHAKRVRMEEQLDQAQSEDYRKDLLGLRRGMKLIGPIRLQESSLAGGPSADTTFDDDRYSLAEHPLTRAVRETKDVDRATDKINAISFRQAAEDLIDGKDISEHIRSGMKKGLNESTINHHLRNEMMSVAVERGRKSGDRHVELDKAAAAEPRLQEAIDKAKWEGGKFSLPDLTPDTKAIERLEKYVQNDDWSGWNTNLSRMDLPPEQLELVKQSIREDNWQDFRASWGRTTMAEKWEAGLALMESGGHRRYRVKSGAEGLAAVVVATGNESIMQTNKYAEALDKWHATRDPKDMIAMMAEQSEWVAGFARARGSLNEASHALSAGKLIKKALGQMEGLDPTSLRSIAIHLAKAGIILDEETQTELLMMRNDIEGNPIEAVKFINRAMAEKNKPSMWDYLNNYRYANMLSSAVTHIYQAVANTAWGAGLLTIGVGQTALDSVRGLVPGQKRQVYWTDLLAAMQGYAQGLGTAMVDAKDIILTGYSRKGAMQALFQMAEEQDKYRGGRDIPGKLGTTLAMPGRLLEAGDVIFSGPRYMGALNQLAVRRAITEGFEPGTAEFDAKVDMLKGSGELHMTALWEAKKLVHTMDAVSSKTVAWLKREGKNNPAAKAAYYFATLTFPFVRISENTTRQGISLLPIGLNMAISNAMDPKLRTWAKNEEYVAKMALGAGIIYLAAISAAAGHAVGELPRNREDREKFYKEGKKPWTWGGVMMNRIGPYAYPFAVGVALADIVHNENATMQDVEDALKQAIKNLGKIFRDHPFLQGFANIIYSLQDPTENSSRVIAGYLGQFVPAASALRLAERMTDTTVRDPNSLKERIAAGIPLVSNLVPPRIGSLGQPMERQEKGWSALNPITPTRSTATPEDKEMWSLGIAGGVFYNKGKLREKKGGELTERDMTDTELRELQKYGGDQIRQARNMLFSSPQYKRERGSPNGKEIAMRATESLIGSVAGEARDRWTYQKETGKPLKRTPITNRLKLSKILNDARARVAWEHNKEQKLERKIPELGKEAGVQ